MDSRQARELMAAMEGAAGSWAWTLHPTREDMNKAAHDAGVLGEQVSAFIFQQIVDSWGRGESPATVTVKVEVGRSDQLSITCPKCQRTSFNPSDVQWGYCGACHQYTSSVNA